MSTNLFWLNIKVLVFLLALGSALYFVIKKDPFHYRQHAHPEVAGTLRYVLLRDGLSEIALSDGRHIFITGNVYSWKQDEVVRHPLITVNGSEEIDKKQWCISEKCYPEKF